MSKVLTGIVIAAGIIVACSVNARANKPTCEDKCQTVWSEKLDKCGNVEQCVKYVHQEFAACVRHCKVSE